VYQPSPPTSSARGAPARGRPTGWTSTCTPNRSAASPGPSTTRAPGGRSLRQPRSCRATGQVHRRRRGRARRAPSQVPLFGKKPTTRPRRFGRSARSRYLHRRHARGGLFIDQHVAHGVLFERLRELRRGPAPARNCPQPLELAPRGARRGKPDLDRWGSRSRSWQRRCSSTLPSLRGAAAAIARELDTRAGLAGAGPRAGVLACRAAIREEMTALADPRSTPFYCPRDPSSHPAARSKDLKRTW
jgi:hypothetical protein